MDLLMRHLRLNPFMLVIVLSAQLLLNVSQARGQYDLSWNTVDGGGATSTGGAYSLTGTMGQPDASIAMTGGAYSITGGFWPGATPPVSDCPADIVPSGTVNIDDLLAVISAWGACPLPCPPRCPADIAPAIGNCAVNIDDLLAVISAWGACP
jgi:hypothetical protein